MEISELPLSKLENFNDYSSEYYLKGYIEKSKVIRGYNYKLLSEISFITDGEHGSPDWDDNSDIKYITAEFIKPNYILDGDYRTISIQQDKKNARARLTENDVLIYSVGAYAGYAAKAEKHLFPANIPRSVAIVRPLELLNPEYLSIFLNSKYGIFQTTRFRAGNSQPVLALEKIKQFEIPILSSNIQEKLKDIYNRAYTCRQTSKQKYILAQDVLLKETGLSNLKLSLNNVNVKSFSESFGASSRLDAEYYQPKYDQLYKIIKSNKIVKKIEDIKTFNSRGLQPIYVTDGDLAVINSKNILDKSLDYTNFERTSSSYWDLQQKARVYEGDILTYTTGANIGRTQIYRGPARALASNHVNILRLKSEYNASYVAFVINSLIGKFQTEKLSAGSAQAELYPKDIDQFLVPILEKSKQDVITSMIEACFHLEMESQALLEIANNAVEIAIEQSETTGLKYIKDELSKL